MGEAYFYHLTESTAEVALGVLIERARGAGWRVEVRVPDAAIRETLDVALWAGDDRFLPHGIAGGDHDALQPVLLCVAGQRAANGATCLMSVGGAGVTADEIRALDRACVLFDGQDTDAVAAARRQWKEVTDAGIGAQYWAQVDGRWTKKAESAAA